MIFDQKRGRYFEPPPPKVGSQWGGRGGVDGAPNSLGDTVLYKTKILQKGSSPNLDPWAMSPKGLAGCVAILYICGPAYCEYYWMTF